MSRNRLLSLLLAGALAVSAIPGCVAPGIPSSFIAAVRLTAIALPAFDIAESQLEAHAGENPSEMYRFDAHEGAIPFKMYLFVEPLTPEEGLEIDLDAVKGEEAGHGTGGEELEITIEGENLTYIPDPVYVDFGFQSDGVCLSAQDLINWGDALLTPPPARATEFGFDAPPGATTAQAGEAGQPPVVVKWPLPWDDGSFAYTAWVEVPEEGGGRRYYRNDTLDSARGEDIRVRLEGGNLEDLEREEDVHLGTQMLVWEIDPMERPTYLFLPVAPLVTISPIEFPDTSDLWGAGDRESYWVCFEERGFETTGNVSCQRALMLATLHLDPGPAELAEVDALLYVDEPPLDGDQAEQQPETPKAERWAEQWVDLYRFDPDLSGTRLYENILGQGEHLAAFPPLPAFPPITYPALGFDDYEETPGLMPHRWNASPVDDEPEGGDDPGAEPEAGNFVWVSDGQCYSQQYGPYVTVLSFPVEYDSLFNPDEPHGIQLPWTFWLSLLPEAAPQEDEAPGPATPEDSGESAPPQDEEPAPESFLAASIEPVSETIEDESGCRSILTIGYGAVDLTGGGKPVSDVSLRVDGEELYPWSGTPTDHYQDSVLLESGCSEVHVVQVAASNADGQTVTATREVRVPPLSTHFGYGILDVPGEGECRMQLFIEYEAVDLTTPDSPLTNVVVKANGSVWADSGAISTDRYADSFSREVGCGQTYLIEVTGTDTDGSTYTYRETVNIPVPTPPEPPPPQTTLYAAYAASAHCTASGPECSCSLSISFDGKDLTGGDYPVTKVVLQVNGQVWHDSGSVSTTHYHQTEHRTVNCGETFNMVLTVNNSIGQTATSTGSLTTPVP